MKNLILKERKNKRIIDFKELIKGVKRLLFVICYVAVVVNIITPNILWSIPFVFAVYILWSMLPLSDGGINTFSLSRFVTVMLLKLSVLYLLVVICFNIWLETLPCVLYGVLCVEGLIYNFSYKGTVDLKKLFALMGITFMTTAVTFITWVTTRNTANIICFLCGIPVVVILSAYIFTAKRELLKFIRMYFNSGKDKDDED